MTFDHDIMISYAWRDNEPPPMSNQEGWVSGLQAGLEYWLKQLMPRQPKVWRDKNQMPGNKVFANELDSVVGKTAILLAILSEPYLASEWCGRERENFIKIAKTQGGLEIANDYRIFKINKLPVDRKAIPPDLNIVTGFDFFEIDSETRQPAPFDPNFGEKEKQRFLRKIYDVAVALSKLLKKLEDQSLSSNATSKAAPSTETGNPDQKDAHPENAGNPEAAPTKISEPNASVTPGLVVYIPHTTRDLREVRDDLVSELLRRNCIILPEQQFLYEDMEALKQAVEEDLKKAAISIHLIGARYGTVMEGETRSVIELQNLWAAEESKRRQLRRLIWLPKEMVELADQQRNYIENLRKDRELVVGADLLEDSVENLKSLVLDMLKPKPVQHDRDSEVLGEKSLYLMHNPDDKDEVRALRKALRDKEANGHPLKMILPVFDGEPAELREINRQRLTECDGVIVFWGSGSQAWLESCLGEVKKAPGYGRTKGWESKHLVYLAGAETSTKEDWWLDFQDQLWDDDIDAVNAFKGVPEAELTKFIESIC